MNTSENIPLLTDIIQLGDKDMKNHFDGHVLDDDYETHEKPLALNSETEADNPIPAIRLDTETHADIHSLQINPLDDAPYEAPEVLELPLDDNPDESLSNNPADDTEAAKEIAETTDTDEKQLDKDELTDMVNLLVSDAVDAILPIIEGQLKQSISEQIIQKLSRKLD